MFFRLVDGSNVKIVNPDFDEDSWPTLWGEYLTEARKFDEKTLLKIFGDTEPVREPSSNSLELSDRDRLLIGEFLRRHHARLAHDMSVGGILTSSGVFEPLKAIEHP
jgi:hypothetical protein